MNQSPRFTPLVRHGCKSQKDLWLKLCLLKPDAVLITRPPHAHACRQGEQQVTLVKNSNTGGDKTQTDKISRFLRLLSQQRSKLSLIRSAKPKGELKADEVNYRDIVGG